MTRRDPSADLLTRLLVRHWKGGIDQHDAAKLIGIRKDEFAELSALRHCLLILENMGWRYYLARFNHAFPECDRASVKRQSPHNSELWAPSRYRMQALDSRAYTDAELLTPPQRELETEASA